MYFILEHREMCIESLIRSNRRGRSLAPYKHSGLDCKSQLTVTSCSKDQAGYFGMAIILIHIQTWDKEARQAMTGEYYPRARLHWPLDA